MGRLWQHVVIPLPYVSSTLLLTYYVACSNRVIICTEECTAVIVAPHATVTAFIITIARVETFSRSVAIIMITCYKSTTL